MVVSLLPVACGPPSGGPPAARTGVGSEVAEAGARDPGGGRERASGEAREVIPISLVPGVARPLELAPGTCHAVKVPLEAGQGMTFVLDQQGVDVVTRLLDPSGDHVLTFDAPVQGLGRDAGAWIAERSGAHRLEICAGDPGAGGSYRIVLDFPVAAGDRLRQRVAGFRAYMRGRARLEDRDPGAARRELTGALEHWRAAGDELAQAWALDRLGHCALDLHSADEAARAFERAAAAFAAGGDARSRSRAAAWAGNTLEQSGRARGALAAYRQARAAAVDAGDAKLERVAIEGLAAGLARLGEPLEALARYRQLLDEPRFDAGAGARVRALHRQGLLYQKLGEAQRALALFEQALELADRAGVSADRGKILLALGGARLDLHQDAAAEEALEQARRTLEAGAPGRDLIGVCSRLGRLFVETDRLPEARAMFDRALDLARSRKDDVMAAEIRINRGRLAAVEGDHRTAITVCGQALDALTRAGQPLWSASALNCLADNLAALGRLGEAQEAIEKAIGRLEGVRGQPAPDALRTSLLADRYDYYGRLIEILLRRQDEEPERRLADQAFEVAERSRSRTLLDEIERAAREPRDHANPELLARAETLAAEIAALEQRLLRDDGTPDGSVGRERGNVLRRRVDRLRAERDLVEGQIAAALPGPRVADVSESASLATIQRELLGSGESQLVEYFLGEHGSVVWVIGRDSVTLERSPARPVIERLARKASALTAESHYRHKRVRGGLAAEALAAMVVEPIARSLTARAW